MGRSKSEKTEASKNRVGRPTTKKGKETAFGKLIDKHEISQPEAAKCLGISRAHVNNFATGRQTPALKTAFKIYDWSVELEGKDGELVVTLESWRSYVFPKRAKTKK